MENDSAVGVLNKASLVLDVLSARPCTLCELVHATGLSRPTTHRLATAMECHRLVSRDSRGRFVLGPRCHDLARLAPVDHLIEIAARVLPVLRDRSCQAVQVYRRQGLSRLCVAGLAPSEPVGPTTSQLFTENLETPGVIPTGATLSMRAGSAAQVLLAWEDPGQMQLGLVGAAFTAPSLAAVRRQGWAQSVAERQPGVASVSAPIRNRDGRVIAGVCISGTLKRIGRAPAHRYAPAVVATARRISQEIARAEG